MKKHETTLSTLSAEQITHDPIKNEWHCQLGKLISLRVYLDKSVLKFFPLSTVCCVDVKIGDKEIVTLAGLSTVNKAFFQAFSFCELVIETAQQQLIKDLLKIKENPMTKEEFQSIGRANRVRSKPTTSIFSGMGEAK
jgi:hypothetical protein